MLEMTNLIKKLIAILFKPTFAFNFMNIINTLLRHLYKCDVVATSILLRLSIYSLTLYLSLKRTVIMMLSIDINRYNRYKIFIFDLYI